MLIGCLPRRGGLKPLLVVNYSPYFESIDFNKGTKVEIRADFKSAEMLLNRLIQYSMTFNQNNIEHWPHLKRKEDFHEIYDLDYDRSRPLEKIYCNGRDIAVSMSLNLTMFNCPSTFPTLKSFVDSFTDS